MKYIVIVGDGMADYPLEKFSNKTALQYAQTPYFDRLAARGELGLVQTIPAALPPGSDTANLSVLGYNPLDYYTGRSPYEAASLGVNLAPDDISFRCNLVTLTEAEPFARKELVDYCAGEITTEEAVELIGAVRKALASEAFSFYTGFKYRHLLVWHGAPGQWDLTPPHDISGKMIEPHLPQGEGKVDILRLMEQSYQILVNHPVNLKRIEKGLNPANAIWIWGDGRKPQLPSFYEKYALSGAVISAVDLIKGLGLIAGLQSIDVEGATGDLDTNYGGKVAATLAALDGGLDFVYLHIEAPDECSHRFEAENKIKAIERIDQLVLKELQAVLESNGEPYSILLVTDHATPLSLGTHTRDPIPYVIYRSGEVINRPEQTYDEEAAARSGIFIAEGFRLMDRFLNAKYETGKVNE